MRKNTLRALMIIVSFSFLFTSLNFELSSESNVESNSNIIPNNGGKLPPLPSPVVPFSIS